MIRYLTPIITRLMYVIVGFAFIILSPILFVIFGDDAFVFGEKMICRVGEWFNNGIKNKKNDKY